MSKNNWLDAPTVSGVYWAWRDRGTNAAPSLCKVNIVGPDDWRVTFLSGVSTYRFTSGQGWVWKPQVAPAPPGRRKAVA
jgi:hypothetical protein